MLFMSLNLRMKSKSVMEKWLDSAPIVCATASQSQIEYHSHSGTKKPTTVTVIQMNWQQTNATHNTIDKYIHIWLIRIIWTYRDLYTYSCSDSFSSSLLSISLWFRKIITKTKREESQNEMKSQTKLRLYTILYMVFVCTIQLFYFRSDGIES